MADIQNLLKKAEDSLEKEVTEKENAGKLEEAYKLFNDATCGLYTLCANIKISEFSEGFDLAKKFDDDIAKLHKEDCWKLQQQFAELFLKMRKKHWTHSMWLDWQANKKADAKKK